MPEKPSTPKLLAGGNPQIPKGDGDAPVQAYIEAMPGWKRDVGHRLDELVVRAVPDVRKTVRWNSPFYGVEGQGWFLSFHCFTKYVKVTFFDGASLEPVPPVDVEGRRTPATSTSTRATSSTRRRSCRGWSRPADCRGGAGADPRGLGAPAGAGQVSEAVGLDGRPGRQAGGEHGGDSLVVGDRSRGPGQVEVSARAHCAHSITWS